LRPPFEVKLAHRKLVARGTLLPNNVTRSYLIRIEYREGKRPEVYVEEPKLSRRPQEPEKAIPHTYEATTLGKERPCCFYPRTDWDASRPIATTIIPWLMSWLFDYEMWLATGEWFGGGIHPTVGRGESQRLLKKLAES
jgi:hypothetical protein